MAMKYLYAAFLITALFIVREVDCLNCFSCKSSTSIADCKSNATQKSCPSTSPECVRGALTCTTADNNGTVYYLGCGKGGSCSIIQEEQPSCPFNITSITVIHFKSSTSCCSSGNLCNDPNGKTDPNNGTDSTSTVDPNGGTDSMASTVVPGLSMCLALGFLVSALVCY